MRTQLVYARAACGKSIALRAVLARDRACALDIDLQLILQLFHSREALNVSQRGEEVNL